MSSFHRWLRFNLVGIFGMAVQLTALALFNRVLHSRYLLATTLALELTLLHNFFWHERLTWSDRSGSHRWRRLLRFHISNGLTSLAGNLVVMRILVERLHVRLLLANGIAIAICSIANFLLSHHWAFALRSQTATPR